MAEQNEGESDVTTDHEKIRDWTEERDGFPAAAEGTEEGEDAGVLRIGFEEDGNLDEISWSEFFDTFEEQNLAFVYQEEADEGDTSRFFEFVDRDDVGAK